MKQKLFLIAAFVLCAQTAMFAQRGNRGNRDREQNFDITEIYNRQASRIASQLKLKDETKDLFTVLYLDYQNARHNAANPTGGDSEGAEQRVDFNNLSDEDALALIDKNFERQAKQLEVDKEYLPKFLEILTPAQTAQVYLQGNGPRPNNPNRGGGPRQGGNFGGGLPGGQF